MSPQDLLTLLFNLPEPDQAPDMRGFLKNTGMGPSAPSAFDRLVRVAACADTRARAGAAGHQAAIRRLFPQTPEDAITAFCISEDQGPRPSRIFTTLEETPEGWRLNGTKRWGSMSPNADILYVAASTGWENGQNRLRMVRVPADSDGLVIDTGPYEGKYGEMGIADITLTNVPVDSATILPDDAYEAFIKPFRLIEDVYNTAGTQIGLLRLALSCQWPEEIAEKLVSLILQAQGVSETDMASPESVLLISAYLRESEGLWQSLSEQWQNVPEELRQKWQPEMGLLEVAARARETRRQNAWVALRG